MPCRNFLPSCTINYSKCIFYKDIVESKKQEHFFKNILIEKDCAMSSLDYLIYEDSKLDEPKKNEKISQINDYVFLISSRSNDQESTFVTESTGI